MRYTLKELAERLGVAVEGDATTEIEQVATLEHARAGSIAFLAHSKYKRYLVDSRASAVILPAGMRGQAPMPALLSDNPYLTYAKVSRLLNPAPEAVPGIHPSAVIHDTARVHERAQIGANAVVEAGAEVAANVVVGAGCVVCEDVVVGEGTVLRPNVTLERGVRIGKRCLIHPGAVIGADGFGLADDGGTWLKVPQIGSVRVGDDVEIGANTTIDRGALEDTVIGNGVKLDNLIMIAHNVQVGEHTAMAGCVGVAGSTTIGRHCTIAGGAGVSGHLELCDNTHVTAMSLVSKTLREPGSYSSGTPLEPTRQWRKNSVRFRQLDELARRLFRLEEKQNSKDGQG